MGEASARVSEFSTKNPNRILGGRGEGLGGGGVLE